MNCLLCKNLGVYQLRESDHWLCKKHTISNIKRRVKKTIRFDGVFEGGLSLAVYVDGGVKSQVLVHILSDILSKNPKAKLVVLSMDPSLCRQLTEKRSFDCRLIDGSQQSIGLLSRKSKELGFNKLIGLDCLDDIVARSFKDVLTGKPTGIKHDGVGDLGGPRAKVFNPLRDLSLSEIQIFAEYSDIKFIKITESLTEFETLIRQTIEDFEQKHPGIRHQIQSSNQQLLDVFD